MKNAWTALGALAAGAAAMYLTDPEQGARRRSDLRQRFANATDDALDNLQYAGNQAVQTVQGAAQDGRGLLQDILSRVQSLAEQGRHTGREALHRVEDGARDVRSEYSGRWHEGHVPQARREGGGGGGLLLAASGIVVGAAAIYLLKTESGRRRLDSVREQARHMKDQLGQQLSERKEQISQQISQRKDQLAQRLGKQQDSAAADSEADDAAYSAPATRESVTPALGSSSTTTTTGNRPAAGSSSELQGGGGWH